MRSLLDHRSWIVNLLVRCGLDFGEARSVVAEVRDASTDQLAELLDRVERRRPDQGDADRGAEVDPP